MNFPPSYEFDETGSVHGRVGAPRTDGGDNDAPQGQFITEGYCFHVEWSETVLPADGDGEKEGRFRHWDVYPGEDGHTIGADVWVSIKRKGWMSVSPPEWARITHPFRVVVARATNDRGEVYDEDTKLWQMGLIFSHIPDDEIDHERVATARRYWADPEAFLEDLNPQCTTGRVFSLIGALAEGVPTGYATPNSAPVPAPAETKYPAELEAYFAAMDHHGLTDRTHLFPSAGPIGRDRAVQIRKDLTDRERTNSGRIARSPSPHRYWVTGLFPITARGHWGLAVDVSSSSTRGSVWAYYEGEDTLIKVADSLCDFLSDAVAAYTDGAPFQRYVLTTDGGNPRWLIPDSSSGTRIPEPRDL